MASKKVRINSPRDQAINEIRSAVEKKGWTISEFKASEGLILAKTKPSIWSWGEDVVIRVKALADGSMVEIESTPSAQILDWGRSEGNVASLASEIGGVEVTS
jgi:hypothetical protein